MLFSIFQRQKEEQERRARVASSKSSVSSEQDQLMLELAEKVGGLGGGRRQRAKIDSTRMDHGDFEKLMNGEFDQTNFQKF